MRFMNFYRLGVAALLLAASVVAASAQVVTASGRVTLRQADGTTVPVQGAVIKFYRTDIKQELNAKTDKGGRYVNAGIPLVGTFTIAVSAPGARPDYLANVKISAKPENDFILEPGDGSALTLEQIKSAAAAAPAAGTGRAAGTRELTAEEKKMMEEEAKKRAEVEAKNRKIEERNTQLPPIFNAANTAYSESIKLSGADKVKKIDEAVTLYDQGLAIDPEEAVLYLNKGIALRSRGVERYNAAARSKDKAEKDAGLEAARADLKNAVEASEKGTKLKLGEAAGTTPGATAGTPAKPDESLLYLSSRAESYRLALTTSTPIDNDAAAKAIEDYIAAEPDQAKKDKSQADLGLAFSFAGKYDEAIAKFREVLAKNPNNLDAIHGLGIALASKAGDDANMVTEAKETLQQFASKAPDTNPRKAEALEMVKYLDDTLKGLAASKKDEKKPAAGRRRN